MNKAFVTGAAGQDDADLAELLLGKGSEVHGLVRRSSMTDVDDRRLHWLDTLFDQGSPLCGVASVTRSITDRVARVMLGMREELRLGDLDGERDLGGSRDHVGAMRPTLQRGQADDDAVATGPTVTMRDSCRIAFDHAGVDWAAT